MNEPLWSAALSLRAQIKRLNIPAAQISNVQHVSLDFLFFQA